MMGDVRCFQWLDRSSGGWDQLPWWDGCGAVSYTMSVRPSDISTVDMYATAEYEYRNTDDDDAVCMKVVKLCLNIVTVLLIVKKGLSAQKSIGR